VRNRIAIEPAKAQNGSGQLLELLLASFKLKGLKARAEIFTPQS